MARNEVRKECPSCGLGVSLDAKVCEFCGWDFNEEEEWISQIDKLEQELITEKRKFEDTSVDKMIQSTLRNPSLDEAGEESAPQKVVVKKKRIEVSPQAEEKLAEPLPATEEEEPKVEEVIEELKPSPQAPKQQPLRIVITDLPEAPQNLELDLAEDKAEEAAPGPVPAVAQAEQKPAAASQQQSKQPVAAPTAAQPVASAAQSPTQPKQGKVVRRVVSKPAAPADRPVQPKPPVQAAAKPATQKQASPAAAPRQEGRPKEEKKSHFGGFGKMFSMSAPDSRKDDHKHSAPEKIHMDKGKSPPKPSVKVFVCPLCNKEVKETEKKCPSCGAEFE